MRLDQIGLLSTLKAKMGWLGDRQRVVAQNVANDSTPGYAARDVKPLNFEAVMKASGPNAPRGMALMRTSSGHIASQSQAATLNSDLVKRPDSETTLDGNSVVLEEQMLKMAESRMQFDAAIGFYQKSLTMIRLASRMPGR
ncbi:MAG: flagellar basal body rod protein FlgB [Asticcacaulis sp.]